MRKYNPYRNVFYFYRGPGYKKQGQHDKQVEDNTTKALVNVLENSRPELLKRFLTLAGVDTGEDEVVAYDLQVTGVTSRPDAEIVIGSEHVYVESKVGSVLDEKQIKRHLITASPGFLIIITPRDSDRDIVERFRKSNLKFITWREIYTVFDEQRRYMKEPVSKFLIGEFLGYLEAIDMAPFTGWEKGDFEAFLNIEDDPEKLLRLRVKEKFRQYLEELEELIAGYKLYGDLRSSVGSIREGSDAVWGVLCKPPLNDKVQKPHFNYWLDSDGFGMGIQIEAKSPTYRMRRLIKGNRDVFTSVLKNLKGFDLIIRERIKKSNRPRDYKGFNVLSLRLGAEITSTDVDYVISATEKFPLFEIHCASTFKRDDAILREKTFLKKSARLMERLNDYYRFSLGLV